MTACLEENSGETSLPETSVAEPSLETPAADSALRLFATADEPLRFVPKSLGFIRRAGLVNALLAGWPVVVGTGSWVEAHLVARLGMAARVPNLKGCGINAREVWDLVQEALVGQTQPPLVILLDSLEGDQGRSLIHELRALECGLQILLLVEHDHWLSAETLQNCQAQAIVHVHSFGSGVFIRALQALRRGQTFQDPLLLKRMQKAETFGLTPREEQVLQGLSRGLTNKQIAQEQEIAATTVRDYVSSLCRKLGARNRTSVVSQAISLGLVRAHAIATRDEADSKAEKEEGAESPPPAVSETRDPSAPENNS